MQQPVSTFGRAPEDSRRNLQDRRECTSEFRPLIALFSELLPAGGCNGVDLHPPAGLRLLPLAADEITCLEPVQRRLERAGVDGEHVAGQRLDPLREIVPVRRLRSKELEDDQIEGALEQRWSFRLHGWSTRRSSARSLLAKALEGQWGMGHGARGIGVHE